MVKKAKPAFINILAIVSIAGFAIISFSAFGIIDLSKYLISVFSILLGIGLLIEGNIRALPAYLKKGLTENEIVHIIAAMVGAIILVAGIIALPQFNITLTGPLGGVIGVASILAIIIVILEVWFVK